MFSSVCSSRVSPQLLAMTEMDRQRLDRITQYVAPQLAQLAPSKEVQSNRSLKDREKIQAAAIEQTDESSDSHSLNECSVTEPPKKRARLSESLEERAVDSLVKFAKASSSSVTEPLQKREHPSESLEERAIDSLVKFARASSSRAKEQ